MCTNDLLHYVEFGGDTPLGRPGQPDELASIFVQFADNKGNFAT